MTSTFRSANLFKNYSTRESVPNFLHMDLYDPTLPEKNWVDESADSRTLNDSGNIIYNVFIYGPDGRVSWNEKEKRPKFTEIAISPAWAKTLNIPFKGPGIADHAHPFLYPPVQTLIADDEEWEFRPFGEPVIIKKPPQTSLVELFTSTQVILKLNEILSILLAAKNAGKL
jgi:hypothetical protein